jgi:hypothetical protein
MWAPGQSGNPKGRPRIAGGLAQRIRAATGDGQELLDFVLDVLRDPASSDEMKRYAHTWLSNRGHGKEPIMLEVAAAERAEPEVDYSRLSVEELEALERMMVKLLPAPAAAHEVVDVASDGIIDEQ